MNVKVTDGLVCPYCGATEIINPDAPLMEQRCNIRAYKVHDKGFWWSQCLVCLEQGQAHKGWFHD